MLYTSIIVGTVIICGIGYLMYVKNKFKNMNHFTQFSALSGLLFVANSNMPWYKRIAAKVLLKVL